jgi:hypothetical protein
MFGAIVLTLVGCNNSDSFNPDSSVPPGTVALGSDAGVQLASASTPTFSTTSFAGGIPIGIFALPTSEFGSRYNGAMRNISPSLLLSELAAIKSRGGKVVLNFTGNQRYFTDASGHFSLSKWEQRVDRFRSVNFSSYINDGTIVGHFLIDEPNDPANFNGQAISPSTVETMAKYSKSIWSGLTTIARAEPSYFGTAHYLDAAWAQYLYRKGSASDYIRKNVNDAQNRGLQLVVGMNVINGGPNGGKMSATQIKDWGSTLLGNSYPCSFLSWNYDNTYLSSTSIKDAMTYLRNKAQNRSTKTCK